HSWRIRRGPPIERQPHVRKRLAGEADVSSRVGCQGAKLPLFAYPKLFGFWTRIRLSDGFGTKPSVRSDRRRGNFHSGPIEAIPSERPMSSVIGLPLEITTVEIRIAKRLIGRRLPTLFGRPSLRRDIMQSIHMLFAAAIGVSLATTIPGIAQQQQPRTQE